MTEWLSKNGLWIVPLAAIVGTLITVVFRIWQMSKAKCIEVSPIPSHKRAVRISILLQDTAKTIFGIAFIIFLLMILVMYAKYESKEPVTEEDTTPVLVLFLASLGLAVFGAIILFIGKFGHEWFRD